MSFSGLLLSGCLYRPVGCAVFLFAFGRCLPPPPFCCYASSLNCQPTVFSLPGQVRSRCLAVTKDPVLLFFQRVCSTVMPPPPRSLYHAAAGPLPSNFLCLQFRCLDRRLPLLANAPPPTHPSADLLFLYWDGSLCSYNVMRPHYRVSPIMNQASITVSAPVAVDVCTTAAGARRAGLCAIW